jgi:hypothetical protein
MSEPAYAFLLRGTSCELCGTTPKKTDVDYNLRVRLCHKCCQKNLRTKAMVLKEHKGVHEDVFEASFSTECELSSCSTPFESLFVPLADSSAGEKRLDGACSSLLSVPLRISSPPPPFIAYYFLPDVLIMSDNLETLDDESLELFLTERRKVIEKVNRDAEAIFEFESNKLDEEIDEDNTAHQSRVFAIYAKLKELGHEETE